MYLKDWFLLDLVAILTAALETQKCTVKGSELNQVSVVAQAYFSHTFCVSIMQFISSV